MASYPFSAMVYLNFLRIAPMHPLAFEGYGWDQQGIICEVNTFRAYFPLRTSFHPSVPYNYN